MQGQEHWAQADFEQLKKDGIAKGRTVENLDAPATRGEVAVMLRRVMDKVLLRNAPHEVRFPCKIEGTMIMQSGGEGN